MTDTDLLIRQLIGGEPGAAAHLDGDADRVDALARDHLADHPDNLLVSWIAANRPNPEGTPS